MIYYSVEDLESIFKGKVSIGEFGIFVEYNIKPMISTNNFKTVKEFMEEEK